MIILWTHHKNAQFNNSGAVNNACFPTLTLSLGAWIEVKMVSVTYYIIIINIAVWLDNEILWWRGMNNVLDYLVYRIFPIKRPSPNKRPPCLFQKKTSDLPWQDDLWSLSINPNEYKHINPSNPQHCCTAA